MSKPSKATKEAHQQISLKGKSLLSLPIMPQEIIVTRHNDYITREMLRHHQLLRKMPKGLLLYTDNFPHLVTK